MRASTQTGASFKRPVNLAHLVADTVTSTESASPDALLHGIEKHGETSPGFLGRSPLMLMDVGEHVTRTRSQKNVAR